MAQIEVTYYVKENGDIPVKEFIDSLDVKMAAKVRRTIALFRDNGSELRSPYSEYLTDGIYELRTKQGSNITRVLYFFVIGNEAVLTNGFTKKTQKTPRREIDTAKQYREDYMKRAIGGGEQ
jgi:phage-related protein